MENTENCFADVRFTCFRTTIIPRNQYDDRIRQCEQTPKKITDNK